MRDLTLEKVHRLVAGAFDRAVVLQSYVHRVSHRENLSGCMLGADGVLYYDQVWWARMIDTPQKARHAVVAEVMRQVLTANLTTDEWQDRVAAAAVVNAWLYQKLGYHELPRAMYSAVKLPECFMRPLARGFPDRFRKIYDGIWNREPRYTSVVNVARAFKIIFAASGDLIDLRDALMTETLGSSYDHGVDTDGKPKIKVTVPVRQLPDDTLEDLSKDIEGMSGFSDIAQDWVVEKVRSRQSLRQDLIKKFAIELIARKARKEIDDDPEPEDSPVPTKISRHDAARMAMGWIPTVFEIEEEQEIGLGGLAVYVDVSGSFDAFIPYALGIVDGMIDIVQGVYQFSNMVAESSIADLEKKKHRVVSTKGTDFDCVMRHALDHKFAKVVIITDGFADVTNKELRKEAETSIDKVLVLLVSRLPQVTTSPDGDNVVPPRLDYIPQPTSDHAKKFLDRTWMGKTFGSALDISEAFE